MRSASEIINLYASRRSETLPIRAIGTRITQIYDGQIALALPELDKNEAPAVANLIQTGIDQHAMRIASVLPVPCFVPNRVGNAEKQRTRDRHDTIYGWWAKNRMPLLLRKRARDLIALSNSPVLVRPPDNGIPRWHVREPLASYPAPCLNPTDLVPPDCIFTFRRSLAWLESRYPEATLRLAKADSTPDTLFDCLEYVDAEQITLLALGRQDPYGRNPGLGDVVLTSAPNLAQRPLAVVPGRITLNQLAGQFDQMVGMYLASAKLWGLHLHAVSRGIFGESWLESRQNETAVVLTEADPIEGVMGVVKGGTIKTERVSAGVQTIEAINHLERAQRLTGAVPAEMGGEAASNIRTARRGGQLMSASVDFPVQEHQELLAASLEEENRIAIALAKAYAGNKSVSMAIPGSRANLSYKANDIFETEDHLVKYAYAGTDTNGLVIEGGQRLGMKTISREHFMEIDPMIDNPDYEHDRIIREAIEDAILASIQAQAANPDGPYQPGDLGRLMDMVTSDNLDIATALQKLNEEVQERQVRAAMAQATPAELQPGLATPGAPGTAQALAPIAAPPQGLQNLMRLTGALVLPRRTG